MNYGGMQGNYGGNMGGGNIPMGGMNSTYMFSGNPLQFQTRMETATEPEIMGLKDANINLTGIPVSSMNFLCLCCTILWGSCLIFPLFFMCCDWWRAIVYPSYQVPLDAYKALAVLMRSPTITDLNLIVMDSFFDATKSQAIFEAIQHSSLRTFTFTNAVM